MRHVVGVGEHVGDGPADLPGQHAQDVENPLGVIRWSGRCLRGHDGPRIVGQDGVCERAPDIHPDHVGHGVAPCLTGNGHATAPLR